MVWCLNNETESKVREGNYALAGHTTDNSSLLFTPLHHIKYGDSIYLTDSVNIYIYKNR